MADSQTGQTSPTVRVFTLPAIGWRYELTDERKYALRASLLVFVATFLVYWTLGPHKTAYDFQLSQANNMIHGHLDMTEEYTRNLRVLERVLYDPAVGFCLPVNDPRGPGVVCRHSQPASSRPTARATCSTRWVRRSCSSRSPSSSGSMSTRR